MRNIKFKLLFEGDEQALLQGSYEISTSGGNIVFKTEALRDIAELEGRLDTNTFGDLMTYFAFSGFSLYFIDHRNVLYFILYRQHGQLHQIYERGYLEL